ncbi:MAG: hypothetical protein RR405_04195, partial [Clostridia bacterium]
PKDETKEQYFSDAAYVDATGLGFGKIKLSGFAGILGANQIVEAGTAALVAGGTTSTADVAGSQEMLGVVLEIENGKIGITVQRSMIDTIFKMANLTIPDGLMPPIQDVGIEINYSDAGLTDLRVNATLDPVGTKMTLAIGGLKVAVGKEAFDSKTFISQAKKGYGGITFSKVGGLGGLIQGALDSLAPGLAIVIDKNTWSTTTGAQVGFKWTCESEQMPTTVALIGQKKMSTKTGDAQNIYRITLDLRATHPRHKNSVGTSTLPYGASVMLQHNSLLITNLKITDGLIDTVLNAALKEIALPGDGTDLFNIMGTGADKGIYDYPKNAATAGAVENDATTSAATNGSGWNKDGTYSYKARLDNLIKSLDLNLFSGNGYMPYYVGMGAVDAGDPRFISIKVTFNKDPFNELLVMVYALLINLFSKYLNTHPGDVEYWVDSVKAVSTNTTDDGFGGQKGYIQETKGYLIKGGATATQILNGLDAIRTTSNNTQDVVNYMEPFVRCFPYMLEKVVLTGVAGAMLPVSYGLLQNIASETLTNLSKLIATVLPLPFASGTILPSANIYLDLAPKANEYGLDANKKVHPGIQAIEIMINCKKDATVTNNGTYGTNMIYNKRTKTSDFKYMANDATMNPTETTTSRNDSWDSLVLRINPLCNITQVLEQNNPEWAINGTQSDYSNSVLAFDEAESAQILGNTPIPTKITITDPAKRSGVVTAGGAQNDIVMNGDFLNDYTIFPRYAKVIFAGKGNGMDEDSVGNPGSVNNHLKGTTIVWDSSSVDLTAT